MKPLMLKGGERSLTKIQFNREGDLLFTTSKDKSPFVWFSENGERLGTYEGHKGAVWSLDVSYDSRRLVTGGGDNRCILWDTETGKQLANAPAPTVVRCVGFSYSAQLFFYSTLSQMKHNASVHVVDMRDGAQVPWSSKSPSDPYPEITPALKIPLESGAFGALWSHLDDTIITGQDKGELYQFDIRGKTDEPVNFSNEHKKRINDLQLSSDGTMVISSSKDQTSRLFDARSLEHLKTYKSERPVNSASISPSRDQIILGGGEDAMTVTQTATSHGAFEAKLYHLVFEEEFARIKGHFGPINTLAFHPTGNGYASGAEDGYVRIQMFDDDYHNFDFDY